MLLLLTLTSFIKVNKKNFNESLKLTNLTNKNDINEFIKRQILMKN